MRTLLRISFFVIFFVSSFTVCAQKSEITSSVISTKNTASVPKADKSFIYAIEGGYINSMLYGSSVSSTYFNGARVGATANYNLINNFSLLTGVLYSVVYSDKKQGYPNLTFVEYYTLGHFLDIPLHITYNLPLNKNLKVFAFAGPNFNIGLSLKQDITFSDNLIGDENLAAYNAFKTFTGIEPKPIEFYKESLLNRLNLQVGVGGGVQWKSYQLKSGYDFGINNLNKVDTGNLHLKGWYVTFSYDF